MTRIHRQLILLAGFCAMALVTTVGVFSEDDRPYLAQFSLPWRDTTFSMQPDRLGLGFVYRTYIVSLAHRDDRKADMNRLMTKLDMPNWHYHNATYGDDPRVGNFMRNVQAQRAELDNTPDEWVRLPFSWPSDSFDNYTSPVPLVATPLPPAGAELWPEDSTHATDTLNPMMCAFDDFRIQKYKEGEAQWRYLTPQRVSSYHSHLSVVRRIVDDNVRLGVDVSQWPNKTQTHISLVLEDDVDIEFDIEKRMEVILPLLPFNWDILYLGFCWSSETHFPAIVGEYSRPTKNQLHPAHIPRCLHAYALSPAGAIKVLKHIRHVQFAYGRSNDEAYEWLIWQKRVEGFTTVPPLIIQRKVSKSDVTVEGHDLWRESLDMGVLGTTINGEEV